MTMPAQPCPPAGTRRDREGLRSRRHSGCRPWPDHATAAVPTSQVTPCALAPTDTASDRAWRGSQTTIIERMFESSKDVQRRPTGQPWPAASPACPPRPWPRTHCWRHSPSPSWPAAVSDPAQISPGHSPLHGGHRRKHGPLRDRSERANPGDGEAGPDGYMVRARRSMSATAAPSCAHAPCRTAARNGTGQGDLRTGRCPAGCGHLHRCLLAPNPFPRTVADVPDGAVSADLTLPPRSPPRPGLAPRGTSARPAAAT